MLFAILRGPRTAPHLLVTVLFVLPSIDWDTHLGQLLSRQLEQLTHCPVTRDYEE